MYTKHVLILWHPPPPPPHTHCFKCHFFPQMWEEKWLTRSQTTPKLRPPTRTFWGGLRRVLNLGLRKKIIVSKLTTKATHVYMYKISQKDKADNKSFWVLHTLIFKHTVKCLPQSLPFPSLRHQSLASEEKVCLPAPVGGPHSLLTSSQQHSCHPEPCSVPLPTSDS